MNLFFLDWCAEKAASYYCDEHVRKILIEACQMLYTAHHVYGANNWQDEAPFGGYKISHKNHPMTVWVRANSANYEWTCELAVALVQEYKKRHKACTKECSKDCMQHLKEHKCEQHVTWLQAHVPPHMPKSHAITIPPQCMPDDCKVDNCPIAAYRQYYCKYKSSMASYYYTPVPDWLLASGYVPRKKGSKKRRSDTSSKSKSNNKKSRV
jgi:hypothetical protein